MNIQLRILTPARRRIAVAAALIFLGAGVNIAGARPFPLSPVDEPAGSSAGLKGSSFGFVSTATDSRDLEASGLMDVVDR